MDNIRVRFAPSPTGALHIGGVRTALFNYLFAKANNGTFVLRIEDTDQTRYVEGAEDYIKDTLRWLSITPDEDPDNQGEYGPYRQSERKPIYKEHVDRLLADGNAYYAFDTPEELEKMRNQLKENRVMNPQYDTLTRSSMKNSLTLSDEEVRQRINAGEPYVIRIKIPEKEEVRLNDLVRGWVKVNTEVMDDKVLMKSDGMPTYHLANVVDDYLMKITHVIRGEEWLPSAPLHVLLYIFLGWEHEMPQFAHLPLILKADGNGKLSKRAAEKAGFPIFPLNWEDPETNEISKGFKETGFLPEAMLNFLAFLGWNPGTEQEFFSPDDLIREFRMDRINKAGTKFDFEKAIWFNQQYIKQKDSGFFAEDLVEQLRKVRSIQCSIDVAIQIIDLLKERVTFSHEFFEKSLIIFKNPTDFDQKIVTRKWNDETKAALRLFANELETRNEVSQEEAKELFWLTLGNAGYKPGQFMQMLRVLLTGEGSGPDLMSMIHIIGPKKAADRIKNSLDLLSEQN
ncbi:MAG: glutamate--tRNA ligase [Ekhidna sp.]|nr:glutamate--tRNA ligase [Ekhidna sp.]MBC6425221.1 glutamate--tRNA ligase [Ekhidna sp.]